MTVSLPLFPMGSVLYPGLVLPLNIFEERYRRLIADLAELPEDAPRQFGVVAIRGGSEVAPSQPAMLGEPGGVPGQTGTPDAGADPTAGLGPDPLKALYRVGCMAVIATARTQPDGRSELITSGTTRFRLRSLNAEGAYLVGEVEEIPEQRGTGAGALASVVSRTFLTYQKRLAGARERTLTAGQELPDDPTVLSYLVAAATVADVSVKQRLLEAADTAERLAQELALLRREIAVLSKLPSLPATELTRHLPCPN